MWRGPGVGARGLRREPEAQRGPQDLEKPGTERADSWAFRKPLPTKAGSWVTPPAASRELGPAELPAKRTKAGAGGASLEGV